MKRLAFVFALAATLTTSPAFAQSSGKAASAGRSSASSNSFAWGLAVGGVAVVATVVGVTAASASGSPSTFSH